MIIVKVTADINSQQNHNLKLRYVSPANHFVRPPDRTIEFGGKQIWAGEHMVMFYPAAKRDPEAFVNPDRFDIERSPNRHLAFDTGPHSCLGMHLARLELKVMFEQFLQRVEKIEMAGAPERLHNAPSKWLQAPPSSDGGSPENLTGPLAQVMRSNVSTTGNERAAWQVAN